MASSADNDNTTLDDPMVFIIIGKAYEREGEDGIDIHVMLRAPDDDSAVREALNALSEEGFLEADLDQIGTLTDVPEEEPHASAYKGALEGEVAIPRCACGWNLACRPSPTQKQARPHAGRMSD
jgi:hypothetical protein